MPGDVLFPKFLRTTSEETRFHSRESVECSSRTPSRASMGMMHWYWKNPALP